MFEEKNMQMIDREKDVQKRTKNKPIKRNAKKFFIAASS